MQLKLRTTAMRQFLEDSIQAGIVGGYRKAHKYFDDPTEEIITNSILEYVMLNIEETFIFPGEQECE